MNSKIWLKVGPVVGALAISVLALTGCSPGTTPPAADESSSSSEVAEPAADATLATADSDLGTIVVDSAGMTLYVFDKDVADSGESTCEGDCLVKWPPVVAESDTPTVDGVTGTVGVITRTDGTKQVTLNGLPLYYWAGDAAAGDTTGQAVGDVWWVVAPNGDKIAG
jgi:predicted lipoprotein with Yx(FWY)xxD motif